jgi:hypothetical protein
MPTALHISSAGATPVRISDRELGKQIRDLLQRARDKDARTHRHNPRIWRHVEEEIDRLQKELEVQNNRG